MGGRPLRPLVAGRSGGGRGVARVRRRGRTRPRFSRPDADAPVGRRDAGARVPGVDLTGHALRVDAARPCVAAVGAQLRSVVVAVPQARIHLRTAAPERGPRTTAIDSMGRASFGFTV